MSLSSATRRNNYTGNGSNSVYAYAYRIFSENDLTVVVRDTDGNETTLVKTTDYTVSGVGTSGGNVTLVNASQAWLTAGKLTSGYTLSILREVDIVQDTDIRNQGSFFPETHEDAFDYLTMIDQQQQDQLDRSMRLPNSVDPTDFSMELPADIADHAAETIVINAAGDGLEFGGVAASVPLFAVSASQPSAPASGILSFWLDTTVSQLKVYKQTTATWEVFA